MNAAALLISFGLLVLNGFFVASEYSLTAISRSRIEALVEEGDARARVVKRCIQELPLMLAGALLGIAMASLALGHVAEPAVGHILESAIGTTLPEQAAQTAGFVVALFIVVFFHMVLAEMVPKYLVIARPENIALWLMPLYRLYIFVFRPVLYLLTGIGRAALGLFRIEPRTETLSAYTLEELAALIEESARGGGLGSLEERLLSGATSFVTLDAGAVMVPRTEIVAVRATAAPAEVERVVVESGHTRLPAYAGDLDQVLGFFHAKDLLRVPEEDRNQSMPNHLIRQMLVVPESRKLLPLLFDMRNEHRQFALVVEEHGGTAGIVTIEDILEELVGEIRDEHDVAELGIEKIGEDRWLVPGTLRIDEAADRLGVALPHGEYETLAGFVMDRLGRIPKRRDGVVHGRWRLRVQSMKRRRVVQLLVEPNPDGTGHGEIHRD